MYRNLWKRRVLEEQGISKKIQMQISTAVEVNLCQYCPVWLPPRNRAGHGAVCGAEEILQVKIHSSF